MAGFWGMEPLVFKGTCRLATMLHLSGSTEEEASAGGSRRCGFLHQGDHLILGTKVQDYQIRLMNSNSIWRWKSNAFEANESVTVILCA